MTTLENKVWYLKKSRPFERVGDDAVANCEHLFTQIPYPKRATIFEQGDVGRLVYVVKRGRLFGRRAHDVRDMSGGFVALHGARRGSVRPHEPARSHRDERCKLSARVARRRAFRPRRSLLAQGPGAAHEAARTARVGTRPSPRERNGDRRRAHACRSRLADRKHPRDRHGDDRAAHRSPAAESSSPGKRSRRRAER
jgi:hypothetical protein